MSDAEKRKRYDQFGSDFESVGAAAAGRADVAVHDHAAGRRRIRSISNDLFGGGGGGRRGRRRLCRSVQAVRPRARRPARALAAARGNDLKHELTVPFATAVLGGEAALTVQRQNGNVETIKVKIPAGIDDGKKIRLRGQGEPGEGDAPAGDILLTIHVSPHPYFRRTGNRLDVRVPVTLAEAALGAKIDVPTPQGTIALTVPPNTSSGKRLRIKGHGVRPPTSRRATCSPKSKSCCPRT